MFRRKYWKINNLYSSNIKNGEETTKNISYILHFIDSTRFITSSLSNFIICLSEGLHRIKCKLGHDNKNVKHVELNVSIATVSTNIKTLKMIQSNTNVRFVIRVVK